MVTVIGPLSDPRPLPRKPLPFRRDSGGSNAGRSPHRLGRVLQFLALGLDCTEQVLPRFIEGLGTLWSDRSVYGAQFGEKFGEVLQSEKIGRRRQFTNRKPFLETWSWTERTTQSARQWNSPGA
jgi:hypothetical protein